MLLRASKPSFLIIAITCVTALGQASSKGTSHAALAIQNAGTHLSTLTYHGKPLLAFGCHLEHMLVDDYDYEHWTAWAVRHGMNHCRSRLYHAYYRKYSPFRRMPDGRFDLTQWDERFWQRAHKIFSHLQENEIIVHLLIFPQGTGGHWWQGDGYYLAKNNVHPETEFIRPQKSTAGFWQSWSQGKHRLYEIQTAILWKLIEETANYDNIIYDICHEPFIRAMKSDAQQDLKAFLSETTRRFIKKYQTLRPDKTPLLGLDTDFTHPGETRDWIYDHDRFHIMIQGKNHDPFYITAAESIDKIKRFKKPFCPQESLDLPGIVHIPDIKHKNALTYFEPGSRHHLRKYVWRWIMARSQLIDIYQKGLSKKVAERERYEPHGHNGFEEDALIIRAFWKQLVDYPQLDFLGSVAEGPGDIRMVLSSRQEAVVYLSSAPGEEGVTYQGQEIQIGELALRDGTYHLEIWKPAAPGGVMKRRDQVVQNGMFSTRLPRFVDDSLLHLTLNAKRR